MYIKTRRLVFTFPFISRSWCGFRFGFPECIFDKSRSGTSVQLGGLLPVCYFFDSVHVDSDSFLRKRNERRSFPAARPHRPATHCLSESLVPSESVVLVSAHAQDNRAPALLELTGQEKDELYFKIQWAWGCTPKSQHLENRGKSSR